MARIDAIEKFLGCKLEGVQREMVMKALSSDMILTLEQDKKNGKKQAMFQNRFVKRDKK